MEKKVIFIFIYIFAWSYALGQDIDTNFPPGIDSQTHTAIQKALQWLSTNQNGDGSWLSDGYRGHYPIAMTGLAGLALVASGSTPTRGPYARNIRLAVNYLIRSQHPNGHFMGTEEGRSMYGHGYAMLFLSQVYGMEENESKQKEIYRTLSLAVLLAKSAQTRSGGWGYTAKAPIDEGSVSVVVIQGLRGCRDTGILVPKSIIDAYLNYLEKVQNSDGGISYSSQRIGSTRPPITAAATAGIITAGAHDSIVTQKCIEYCKRNFLNTRYSLRGGGDGNFLYMNLYLSQVMYYLGEEEWSSYLSAIKPNVLSMQISNGSFRGEIGSCYCTSIICLIFLIPYQRLPLFQR